MRKGLLTLLAMASFASPVAAEHLAPRNACVDLKGADAFLMTLTTAVANRSAEMLRPLVDHKVMLDFGGGSGWSEMEARLASPDYRLWEELDRVLVLGCDASGPSELVMPYYWGQDYGDLDAYGTYIVLGDAVPLYASENGSKIVRRLNWEAVEFIGFFETAEQIDAAERWEIRARDGQRGFVPKAALRALVDYRLLATRSDDKWRITYMIAGD